MAYDNLSDDELVASIEEWANKGENAMQGVMRRVAEYKRRKGQATPAPSPAPTPAPTIQLDGQPITGTPIAREPLVRGDLVTQRTDTPLGRNLWLVTLTTGAHVTHAFEVRTPGVFGPAPAPIDYTVTIDGKTYPITQHGPWQRWRVENKPCATRI